MSGGKQAGAGRPKGAKNRRTGELMQKAASAAAAIERAVPNAFLGDAHAYLMAVYKDPSKEIFTQAGGR